MPRVQRRSEALTKAGHIRKIEFQEGVTGQQFPVTTATIPGTTIGEGTQSINFANINQQDGASKAHIHIQEQLRKYNSKEEIDLPR